MGVIRTGGTNRCAVRRALMPGIRQPVSFVESEDRIPGKAEWDGYEADLDVIHLHEIFFGKSVEQVQEYFGEGHSIERMDELLFAPRAVFQYYVDAFAAFVISDRAAGDADSASPFLSLLEAREQRDPGSVKAIYESLAPYIQFIAENQTCFNADLAIYGDFKVRACEIESLCRS